MNNQTFVDRHNAFKVVGSNSHQAGDLEGIYSRILSKSKHFENDSWFDKNTKLTIFIPILIAAAPVK